MCFIYSVLSVFQELGWCQYVNRCVITVTLLQFACSVPGYDMQTEHYRQPHRWIGQAAILCPKLHLRNVRYAFLQPVPVATYEPSLLTYQSSFVLQGTKYTGTAVTVHAA